VTRMQLLAGAVLLLGLGCAGGVVETNVAALALRDHLMRGVPPPGPPWRLHRVRSDLALRWAALRGESVAWSRPPQWPRDGVSHLYAAGVESRAWTWLAGGLTSPDLPQLQWRSRQPIPPSAFAAVLQRAAEEVAGHDGARAVYLGQNAHAAMRTMPLAADVGGATPGTGREPIAVEAEQLRVRLATTRELLNADFRAWTVPGGLVPGWAPDQPASVTVVGRDSPTLRVCTAEGVRDVTVAHQSFRPIPGQVYTWRASTSLVSGSGDVLVFIGMESPGADGNTEGIWAAPIAAATSERWHERTWRASPTSGRGRFVLRLVGPATPTCVAFGMVQLTVDAAETDRR